jgi:hypothetical protein
MDFKYTSQAPTDVYLVLKSALNWYDIFDTPEDVKHKFADHHHDLAQLQKIWNALNELLGHSNPTALLGSSLLEFLEYCDLIDWLNQKTEDEARLWLLEFAEFIRDTIRDRLKTIHAGFNEATDMASRKYSVFVSKSREYFSQSHCALSGEPYFSSLFCHVRGVRFNSILDACLCRAIVLVGVAVRTRGDCAAFYPPSQA